MARVYNFSAGPSMLPEAVLKTAQAELLDYHGSGMSVMEMSHRSKWFDEIINNTEAAMRRVLNIPDNYKVGFFQGGATQQFAMVPLNFMTTGTADYLVTGNFSKKAAEEAAKFGTARIAASSKDKNFTYIHDFRHKICRCAAGGRHPAGGRYELDDLLRAGGCQQVRRHLLRRAEEHCPCRYGCGHRA